jgi:ankyrin repeat protein
MACQNYANGHTDQRVANEKAWHPQASGASVACIDAARMSVYMMAVIHNRVEALSTLASIDSSFISARDINGRTALHWAVAVASLGCIQILAGDDLCHAVTTSAML